MHLAKGTFDGLSGTEVQLFQKLLAGMKGVGVEIGCLDGYSSAVILEASELHLTSIDPFVPDSMEASLIGQEARYRENVAPFGNRSALIKGFSQEVALTWSAQLDFLFIDGDHNYLAVERDYVQWTPLLKPSGILAIHDSRMSRPGGARFHPGPSHVAAERIFGHPEVWEIVGEAYSLTIAKKK